MHKGFDIPQLRASEKWYVFIGHEYISNKTVADNYKLYSLRQCFVLLILKKNVEVRRRPFVLSYFFPTSDFHFADCLLIISSPEPLGSQGELIGWP